jgi:hypothetical protein
LIKISVKGLARFMTSADAARRKTLFDYKHPDPEGKAQAGYYRDATNAIRNFHGLGEPQGWLIRRALSLKSDAVSRDHAIAQRLQQNARAIQQYDAKWRGDRLQVLKIPTLFLQFGDVRVSAYPDLYVRVDSSEKIIKLEFSSKEPNEKLFKIIGQCMFEAATRAGLAISGKDVLVYDVPRGNIFKGARFGSRMVKDIEAACEAISALWERI